MNKTEESLSQSKYAEHRNVTKGYIGRLVKEGRLHLHLAHKAGLYDQESLLESSGLLIAP
jgi:hypothetical protein